mgnify:CR=1 FL=1
MSSTVKSWALMGVAVALLSGCALGERRAAVENMMQFESVDANADGVISRPEWAAFMANIRRR